MTASMFDLSMKEKPRSPFSKLKDKMKGRKHDGGAGDTSSAILPHSAMCNSESSSVAKPQPQPEAKGRRPLLAGTHKLSAAHSMSDLIGTHFRPKLDSMNSIEESGEFNNPSALVVFHSEAAQFRAQCIELITSKTSPGSSVTVPLFLMKCLIFLQWLHRTSDDQCSFHMFIIFKPAGSTFLSNSIMCFKRTHMQDNNK